MATIERAEDTARRDRVTVAALVGMLAVGVGIIAWALRPTPQMGTSDEVFATVDALYTAVREENPKQLDQAEARLRAAHDAGKLPGPAWDQLSGIIGTARAGQWRPAAESLYAFMKGQRRDGPLEPRVKTPPLKGKRK